jgi:hypothetical protein
MVGSMSRTAGQDSGALSAVATGGSVDNLKLLAAAADDCDAHFALVQDGVPPPEGSELELIGKLPKSESMFLIGRDAERFASFSDLRGIKIGVGPDGSGTNHLARSIFGSADLASLDVQLSNHNLNEQLDLLGRGELDLGAFVLDEDAALIRSAVRDRGMQLAPIANLDVIARQYPYLWHGRIGAGQFDPIRVLPSTDRRVFRVDTLVVGNGCAGHADTIAMLTLLSREHPAFLDHNRSRGKSDIYPLSSSSERFFENGGPGLLDQHLPLLVNFLPPSNLVFVIMTISVAFNFMTFWHRFRLWRIDANRDKAEQAIRDVLGGELTFEEIHDMEPKPEHEKKDVIDSIDVSLATLDKLRGKCRRQANSMFVPMGQEWSYRYHNDQIEDALNAIRPFRAKLSVKPPDKS